MLALSMFLSTFLILGTVEVIKGPTTAVKHLNSRLGSTVTLICNISAPSFDPFNNPVVWVKVQDDERLQINLMKVILEPFQKENRFEIAFRGNFTLNSNVYFYWSYGASASGDDSYEILLVIKDVKREDNARYVCEIQGKKSTKIIRDSYVIEVLEPVRILHLTSSPHLNNLEYLTYHFAGEYHYHNSTIEGEIIAKEGELFSLACLAVGGNPVPELSVSLEGRDVTGQFAVTENWIRSGVYGFRRKNLIKILHSRSLLLGAGDHGMMLVCNARQDKVAFEDMTVSSRLVVFHRPLIECQDSKLMAYQSSFSSGSYIRGKACVNCDVKSWPLATSIHWGFKHNQSKDRRLFNGMFEVINPTIQDADDKLKTSVCWRYILSDIANSSDFSELKSVNTDSKFHFPTLKMVASNDVGESEIEVFLLAGTFDNATNKNSDYQKWFLKNVGCSQIIYFPIIALFETFMSFLFLTFSSQLVNKTL